MTSRAERPDDELFFITGADALADIPRGRTPSAWETVSATAGRRPSALDPGPGRPPKLTPAQKRLIPEFLWHGPEAYGFRGEVWTCARIAQVIEEEFGVRYHKGHVGRLLKELQLDAAGADPAGHPAGRGGHRALA